MRCRDVLKLAAVCVAMLSLVCTVYGIAQEEQEPDHLDIVADIEVISTEEPAEPEMTAKQEPTAEPEQVVCIEQEEESQ